MLVGQRDHAGHDVHIDVGVAHQHARAIGKVIEIYVKAYQTAKLDGRIAREAQLSDAELMRIVRNGSSENTTPRLLTIGPGCHARDEAIGIAAK
jgi:hypothetical protein